LKQNKRKARKSVNTMRNFVKMFDILCPPPKEKRLEKSTSAPPGKILSTPIHTSMKNYTIFVKNCVVFHHLATLFNSTSAVSKPKAIAG